MSEGECVTQRTRILDALLYHFCGLIGEPKSPKSYRVKAPRADEGIMPAEIIRVIAVALPIIESDNLLRGFLCRQKVGLPEQSRHLRVVGLDQQVGVVEFASNRHKVVGQSK